MPGELVRTVRAVVPRARARWRTAWCNAAAGVGAMAWAGLNPAPDSPYNGDIGPHRRFTWVRTDLADVKAIKNELGGTVNDVVLASVAGALGRHLRRRGQPTDGARAQGDGAGERAQPTTERGQLGNKVAAMMAPLPVWCQEPVARLDIVREQMRHLKEGGQAVGAQVLTDLTGFAPTDRDGPGLAADGPPAHVQPGGHERARARSSRSTSWAARPSTRSRWCRSPRARAWASRS